MSAFFIDNLEKKEKEKESKIMEYNCFAPAIKKNMGKACFIIRSVPKRNNSITKA